MNRRLSIILGLTAGLALLLVLVGAIPGWERLTLARAEFAFAEQQAARGQGTDNSPTVSSEVLQHQRDGLSKLFIATSEGVDFLELLDTLASDRHVTVDVTFSREPVTGARQTIPLTLTVRGAMPNIFSFLFDAQRAGPLLRVSALTMSTSAGTVTSTMVVETLWE